MAIGSRHDPKTTKVYADEGMGDADDEFTTEGKHPLCDWVRID